MSKPKYTKVLLKLSGQLLLGKKEQGVDFAVIKELCNVVKEIHEMGVKVGIVLGGGNMWRHRDSEGSGMPRILSDQMGMLATIMNGMSFLGTMKGLNVDSVLYSAIEMSEICEPYAIRNARKEFNAGKVVIIAGGTGNPFFTTDSAAALRALELECDVLLKGTKVDGVYDSDPEKNPDAKKFDKISFTDCLVKDLKVMDAAAISLCRDNNMPVRVYSIKDFGNIKKVISGDDIGTEVN